MNEDEKIRQELIDFICWETDKGTMTKEQVKKSNAWLKWLNKKPKCGVDALLEHLKTTVSIVEISEIQHTVNTALGDAYLRAFAKKTNIKLYDAKT